MRQITYLANRFIVEMMNYLLDRCGEEICYVDKKFHFNTLNNYEIEHFEFSSDFITSLGGINLSNALVLKTLRITAETVTEIPADIFVKCNNLETLYLEVGITKIEKTVLEPLKKLVTLRLITKHLEDIPKKIFIKNTKVKNLELHYFSHGPLDRIFSPLVNLEIVKLFNYNREDWGDTELITEKHFSKNKKLVHFSLKNFDFSTIQPRIFHHMSKTRSLVIHQSHLHELEDDETGVLMCRMKNLRHLNFSRNRIPNLKRTSFLYNSELKKIDMDSNSIQELKMLTFMKNNKIDWLCISRNQIYNIENCFFTNLEFLTYLNLSQNKIRLIRDELQMLDLSRNLIEEIGQNAFTNLKKLRILRLESNRLPQLRKFILESLHHLTALNMNKCKLQCLHAFWFGNNFSNKYKDLEEIHCRKNELEQIDNRFLEFFPALKKIDLSKNQLSELKEDSFLKNEFLERINLHGNQIDRIPKNVFRKNWDIKILNLSKNKICEIAEKAFRRLYFLETLNLNNNQIEAIPLELFKTNRRLRNLLISNNILKTFDFKLVTESLICTIDISINPIKKIFSLNISKDVSGNRKIFVDNDFVTILQQKRFFFDQKLIGEVVFNVNSTATSDHNLMSNCRRTL